MTAAEIEQHARDVAIDYHLSSKHINLGLISLQFSLAKIGKTNVCKRGFKLERLKTESHYHITTLIWNFEISLSVDVRKLQKLLGGTTNA